MIHASPGSRPAVDATWLDELSTRVRMHPGVNHLLLARLATGPYTRTDYLNLGLQHYALVGFFARYLELLLVRAPGAREKRWLAEVLLGEYGASTGGHDPAAAYRRFLAAAGATGSAERRTGLCREVWDFVTEHARIVREESFLFGLGALGPAHQWAIPRMFSHGLPGLRRAGFAEEEVAFFRRPVETRDSETAIHALLLDLARTRAQQEQVQAGTERSLELRFELWTGIERVMMSWRQPESVRALRQGLHGPQQGGDLRRPGTLEDLRGVVGSETAAPEGPDRRVSVEVP